MKILWCITGSGHLLDECVEIMKDKSKKHNVSVAFSNAGLEVAKMYGVFDDIKTVSSEIILEETQGFSSPITGKLKGYDSIILAPCTANTVAKIVYGIADSLVSNIVAQAGKAKIPVSVLPTDTKKVELSRTQSGREVTIHCRDIDLKNVDRLKRMNGIKVFKDVKNLKIGI